MSIKQDAVIGQVVPIEGKSRVLIQEENSKETDNFTSILRVVLGEKTDLVSDTVLATIRKAESERSTTLPEHLADLHGKATRNLKTVESVKVADLLNKYQNCFSKNDWDLGLTHLVEHEIKAPVKQSPRRVPLSFADKKEEAIEDLKPKGLVRESVSPWASPIVLLSKKDGGARPCVDYRKVNDLAKANSFLLPRIQDCFDAVAGSSLFSTFDLTSGYFQIPLKEEDICKSAFVCKYGHFEMTRMPFGLNNSAAIFQRTIEMALQGIQWVTCLIYIGDITVFGRNCDEHIARIEEVLEGMRLVDHKLKPKKCEMLGTEVVFLGHLVSGEGVKPNPVNISKIADWPRPKKIRQIKQLVAMVSYYRRYVKNFATVLRPMVELTKKGRKFVWSQECEASFEELKKVLTGADIMGYPLNNAGEF